MNKKLLLNDLSQFLDESVARLTDDYSLYPNELWDSLSLVSTIASIAQHYKLTIKSVEIQDCKNIGDLFAVLDTKIVA